MSIPTLEKVSEMNKRYENMKRVNTLRSEAPLAMIALLDELEDGTGGDYHGFTTWNIEGYQRLKGQLNSYRAQKISQFLGRTISKQKLLKYAKPKGYVYSLTNEDINNWLNDNRDPLLNYSTFNIQVMTQGRKSN